MTECPALTTAQMAEVDRLMVDEFGIALIQMMENAGRNLAELARRLSGGSAAGRRVAVICGTGNNGGGGMVAARHLHNWGATVRVALVGPPARLKDIPAHQWRILQTLALTGDDPDLPHADWVVDAVIGYGLMGNPRGDAADWIRRINEAGRPVLSLDAPSGLDATTGAPGRPCVRATATLTLALPKTGLLTSAGRPWVGDVWLADIGVPPEVYQRMGIEPGALFGSDTLVRVPDAARPADRGPQKRRTNPSA